jgi:V/A-type H+/Na+-transporting ATPase subunit K
MTVDFGLIGIGASFAIAAFGSALGTGVAAQSAVGAWKRAYMQNKPASFLLVAFTGFPLSQTFYGLILMNTIVASMNNLASGAILGIGVFGGMAIGASAYLQGVAAASACDAFGETGKGFANYVLVLGIIESVALLAMVFLMNTIGAITG